MCWLRAGLAKVHVQMLRNILKLLEVKFAHEFPLNPIHDVDFNGFVAFVARRTNLMFYHLWRFRIQCKFQGCFCTSAMQCNDPRLHQRLSARFQDLEMADFLGGSPGCDPKSAPGATARLPSGTPWLPGGAWQ